MASFGGQELGGGHPSMDPPVMGMYFISHAI